MITVRVNQRRLDAALKKFTAQLGPVAVDQAVRRTAFVVGGELMRSLNGVGYSTPKRIDTGRYRAGWSIGVQKATGRAPGPTTASGVTRGGTLNPQRAIDGEGTRTRTTTGSRIRVINNVEYGPFIEDGTQHMRPGHHLKIALLRATVELRQALGLSIPAAWRNELSAKEV